MAVSKSQNAEVKSFAQKMIDDHTKALGEVTSLAHSKGVTLPTEVDAPHKAKAAKLDKPSGDAFDNAYMKDAGVSDHTKVHAKLKGFATKARDADVKALASKMMRPSKSICTWPGICRPPSPARPSNGPAATRAVAVAEARPTPWRPLNGT